MRYFIVCVLATSGLFAQTDRPGAIDIGFRLGAPVNNQRTNLFSTYSQGTWTGGPTVELRLPFRFSLGVDALYRNSSLDSSVPFQLDQTTNPYTVTSTQNSNIWEFPILLKYHLHVGPLRPFISGGVYVSHESVDYAARYVCTGPVGSCKPADYPVEPTGGQFNFTKNSSGPVAGAGFEFQTRYMKITPEVRFIHSTSFPHDNRFTALVGFTFGVRK